MAASVAWGYLELVQACSRAGPLLHAARCTAWVGLGLVGRVRFLYLIARGRFQKDTVLVLLQYKKLPKMPAASISIPRKSLSYFLPL